MGLNERAEFNPERAVADKPYIRVEFVDPLIDPLKGGVLRGRQDVTREQVYDDPAQVFGRLGKRMIYGDSDG